MIRTLKHLFQKAHEHRKRSCSDRWLVAAKAGPSCQIHSKRRSEMLEWSCADSSLASGAGTESCCTGEWWHAVQHSHDAVALNTDTRSVQIPHSAAVLQMSCICSELGLIAMCLQFICIYNLGSSYLETHWRPQDDQWVQSAGMCSPRVWGVARSG